MLNSSMFDFHGYTCNLLEISPAISVSLESVTVVVYVWRSWCCSRSVSVSRDPGLLEVCLFAVRWNSKLSHAFANLNLIQTFCLICFRSLKSKLHSRKQQQQPEEHASETCHLTRTWRHAEEHDSSAVKCVFVAPRVALSLRFGRDGNGVQLYAVRLRVPTSVGR